MSESPNRQYPEDELMTEPIAVNYSFSRACNYNCTYCFNRDTNREHLELPDIKEGLTRLKEAGMRKLDIYGGEPFLFADDYLGPIFEFCKEDLDLEHTSVITNGSVLNPEWFAKYGQYLDVLGVSCDSFDDEVNHKLGQSPKQVDYVKHARDLAEQYQLLFKLNTVVNIHNHEEDMNSEIFNLKLDRWKIFQVMGLEGENDGNIEELLINDEQFKDFADRHAENNPVVTPSKIMKQAYFMLDENMRFVDNSDGIEKISDQSIIIAKDIRTEIAKANVLKAHFYGRDANWMDENK